MEMNNKLKEDALKQLKKNQTAVKELQRDADEAHANRQEVLQQYKDLEKKVKGLEADMAQAQEDLSAAERARRTAESERDDLQEEINSSSSKVGKHFNTVPIGYSDLGYSGRAAYSDLNPCDEPPSLNK